MECFLSRLKIVPELCCQDINATKLLYVEVLGFQIKYERPDELRYLFGRGVNPRWEVDNIDVLYQRVSALAPESIYLEI